MNTRLQAALDAPESAPYWCVRFQTHDGPFHPVWWGKKSGPTISLLEVTGYAQKHLEENRNWLARIDEIYAPK